MSKVVFNTFLILTIFLLCNCGSLPVRIKSQVTSFHNMDELDGVVKYAFVQTEFQKSNLEYETYKNNIRDELLKYNFVETKIKEAKLFILFYYAVGDGITKFDSLPIYGETGVSKSNTYGTINNSGDYTATTSYKPSYGVVGMRDYSYVQYPRMLVVGIFDKYPIDLKNMRYNARVYSEGQSSEMALVMPAMIKSLLRISQVKVVIQRLLI